MRSRIPAIARKETLHIIRDWRTMGIAFVMPALMIFLFAYAITFDIKDVRLAVSDQDKTRASREVIDRFTSSGYFKLAAMADHPEELQTLLDRGQAQIAIAIPKDFARDLDLQRGTSIQVVLDGSDNNTASIASNYVESIFSELSFELIDGALKKVGATSENVPPISPEVRVWFNPELDSTNTIVPGLVASIMMVVAALLTSLTVVRERENGSLEGLIATPVRKHEVLVGKMLPYLAIAMIDCMMVTGIGTLFFEVPFNGDVLAFTFTALIFSLAGLSIGLMASVVASNQFLANQIVVISTMLPSFLLSGFMFPIKSMPHWVQTITYAVPARYFVTICRGMMLKGQGLDQLIQPTAFLVVFSTVLMAMAVARFQKKL